MCGKFFTRLLGLVVVGSLFLGPGKAVRADEKVYQKVMPSVALVIAPLGEGKVSYGTAVMVQSGDRVMITAAHVVGTSTEVIVFAPQMDITGMPFSTLGYYLSHMELGIKAKVVACDSGHDVAVLVPETMPANMQPLPLAQHNALPGQAIFAIGNSGMWRYREGHVRQVHRMQIKSDYGTVEANMIESDAPTNHGDSGGPVVNSNGELLGIAHAISSTEKSVDYTIALDEVTAVLRKLTATAVSTAKPDFTKIQNLLAAPATK